MTNTPMSSFEAKFYNLGKTHFNERYRRQENPCSDQEAREAWFKGFDHASNMYAIKSEHGQVRWTAGREDSPPAPYVHLPSPYGEF